MSMRRYKRDEALKDDKNQSRLDFAQQTGLKPVQPKVTVNVTEKYTEEYSCPFCLHMDKINAFLISRKTGYDKRLGLCPECKNQMMLKTLTAKMTPEDYAQFMF